MEARICIILLLVLMMYKFINSIVLVKIIFSIVLDIFVCLSVRVGWFRIPMYQDQIWQSNYFVKVE